MAEAILLSSMFLLAEHHELDFFDDRLLLRRCRKQRNLSCLRRERSTGACQDISLGLPISAEHNWVSNGGADALPEEDGTPGIGRHALLIAVWQLSASAELGKRVRQ